MRVDDVRSAWTTFALLLSFEFTKGAFRELFSAEELNEITKFLCQIDMSGGIRMLRRVNKRAVELMQINASVHPVLLFEEYLYSAKQERQ